MPGIQWISLDLFIRNQNITATLDWKDGSKFHGNLRISTTGIF